MPEGAVNLVHGGADPGEEIVANPGTQAVGFTGSTMTGSLIAKHAGAKPLLLELGGNGPTIILDDANLKAAISGTAIGCFTNAGQICQSSERILVMGHVKVDPSEKKVRDEQFRLEPQRILKGGSSLIELVLVVERKPRLLRNSAL